ncbi:Uncharacterised protein [uncultured archaeon]|nr:Uncharacterised protein [uncultured archaeon]
MRPRGKRIQLCLPDPYRAGAAFLAWLAKQGQDAEFSECEAQWNLSKKDHPTPELAGIKLDKFIKMMGTNYIIQEEVLRVLAMLPEKGSIRGLARATNHSQDTISSWMKVAGNLHPRCQATSLPPPSPLIRIPAAPPRRAGRRAGPSAIPARPGQINIKF